MSETSHHINFAQVTQEMLLQYVHFNRHYNTLLIQHNRELIDQLKTAVDSLLPGGEFVTVSTADALVYDSFSDVGEIRVYFASKILTPCRMH